MSWRTELLACGAGGWGLGVRGSLPAAAWLACAAARLAGLHTQCWLPVRLDAANAALVVSNTGAEGTTPTAISATGATAGVTSTVPTDLTLTSLTVRCPPACPDHLRLLQLCDVWLPPWLPCQQHWPDVALPPHLHSLACTGWGSAC